MAQLTSTRLIQEQNVNFISRAQFDLLEAQRRISSGERNNSYADIVADVTRLKGLKDTTSRLDSYINSINRVATRLNLVESTLSQLTEAASELGGNISLRRSPTGDSLDLATMATNFLELVEQILNTTLDGSYIYAGTKNDTPPIRTNISVVANYGSSSDDPFIPNSNYYTGNSAQATLRISDGRETSYGITGDNDAFKNLIAAAHLAKEANVSEDPVVFDMATDRLNQAIESIIALRASNGDSLKVMEDSRDSHEKAKDIFGSQIAEINDTDIIAESIRISAKETVLQATFQNFARISSLNLLSFL